MSHPLAICYAIALMGILMAIAQIPTMPRCPFCGKTREHARDCRSKGD